MIVCTYIKGIMLSSVDSSSIVCTYIIGIMLSAVDSSMIVCTYIKGIMMHAVYSNAVPSETHRLNTVLCTSQPEKHESLINWTFLRVTINLHTLLNVTVRLFLANLLRFMQIFVLMYIH